ncbi:MAG: hypothetical protein FJ267_16465 [Planctomycetes bacterium]|nr:hypothetical protein [Planctomycetota bacterium]
MRLLRILQRSHWNNAIGNGVSPTSSPFLLSYQTLPAHVRLMRRLESKTAVASENKLPSGEFEDLGTLVASGWKNEQPSIPGVKANAELQANARQGRYGLKLMARPTSTDEIPTGLSQSPIVVTSPPLSIHSGQAVKITGWTQLTQPVIGSVEGATIQDSVMGKNGAIRVKVATGWQKFEMLRVVPESQELTVTISLHGFGDLAVDDLRITTIELPDDVPESEPAPPLKPARFSPLDNLDIRRFNPIPRRKP